MSGNTITVVRYTTACAVCGYPTNQFVQLGQLPAGIYTVNIVGGGGANRTQQLTVSDPNPPGPPPGPFLPPTFALPFGNYTDQGFDPEEPGWGIAITQHVKGVLFAIWAVYGLDTKPVWYTLQPGSWTAYNTYSGPAYRTTGPYYGGNYANGPMVTETPAGTAMLTFFDPAHGTLQFNVDGASGTKPIARLPF